MPPRLRRNGTEFPNDWRSSGLGNTLFPPLNEVLMRTSMPIGLLFLTGASLATAASESKFKLIGSDQLATLLTDKSRDVALFDANDSNFRSNAGIIPTAKLMNS